MERVFQVRMKGYCKAAIRASVLCTYLDAQGESFMENLIPASVNRSHTPKHMSHVEPSFEGHLRPLLHYRHTDPFCCET